MIPLVDYAKFRIAVKVQSCPHLHTENNQNCENIQPVIAHDGTDYFKSFILRTSTIS